MNAAGIDVSSRKSTVAVLRPFGEVVKLPFDVSHSTEALADLAQQLKALDGEMELSRKVQSKNSQILSSR